MSVVASLIEAIEERAKTEADAVIPVLEVLADPDRPVGESGGTVHETARRINRQRLDAAERRFRAGALDTAAVRERLGVSRQAVSERLRVGTLIAAKIGSRFGYPDWQFSSTGLASGLGDVLGALRAIAPAARSDASGDAAAGRLDVRAADAVMRVPQADLPDRMSLADLLALGDAREVVHRLTVRADQS